MENRTLDKLVFKVAKGQSPRVGWRRLTFAPGGVQGDGCVWPFPLSSSYSDGRTRVKEYPFHPPALDKGPSLSRRQQEALGSSGLSDAHPPCQ